MYQGHIPKNPQCDASAEGELIATILCSSNALDVFRKINNIVQPSDFYNTRFKKIFGAIKALAGKEEEISVITVANALNESGDMKLDESGDMLVRITDNAPLSPNIAGHARIIKEWSIRRHLSTVSSRSLNQIDAGKPVSEIIDSLKSEVENIRLPNTKVSVVSALQVLQKNPQQTALIDGFLNKGEGLIIHAAGGVGKSMLSMFLAVQAAKESMEPNLLFGKFKIKKQMTSLFIQSENSASTINTRFGKMVEGNSGRALEMIFFPDIYDDVLITGKSFEDPSFIQHCINMVHTIEDETGNALDLFIVDPLISFHNGDENDAGKMRSALDGITEISQRTSVTPIVLHHNNRNDDYRGSSAVYDWARNMISLKRVFIGQERVTDCQDGVVVKETARVPAIEVEHQKANNLPLFEKFTIVMDRRFRFSRVPDAIPPDIQERCLEVQQALKDMGGFAESSSKLAQFVCEMTGRGKRTCVADISTAVDHGFINREVTKKGARGAYSYFLNE